MTDPDAVVFLTAEQGASARAQLLSEAIEGVRNAVRQYHADSTEAAWQAVVESLIQLLGDTETYALLGAIDARVRGTRR